ncbi:MAG TPA: RecX family transcriptional regulator [Roseiflexaceae bacterium]|nr:RecX family transcriptional regulator [Roseiflexaceae bacterium]
MPAGTITALRVQEQDAQRVNLFVDGAFAIGLSLATLARERLYVGQQLSAEDYERLERAERADKALHAALRIIETRPRSQAEIRERLRRKGFAPEAVDAALERMRELGLVDDAAFARYWVESRQTHRPRGPGALRDELRRKGVDAEVIAQTLDDPALRGDEAEQALALARAALHKYRAAPDYATFARRLGGFLQRRGFGFETVRPIVDRLWQEREGHREG